MKITTSLFALKLFLIYWWLFILW